MMRDRSNNRIRNNERVLHLIFHLAGFDKSQFNNELKDFTPEEQRSLISAIHQFKAVAAELPDKLVMPELISH
ncbi:Phage-related protein (fragment) [Xenorhabdus cabanillasii JM26]|uniref:Phage-related protein n=2 Tax=Xenorhabdus cabanillasii TaxID=351673 RepID=W1J7F5_9GAMM